MKQVEITSKVVGRGESEGFTSAIPSINLSGFALKSDLLTLEKKFSDFLNVPIIDGTINRWSELETFLAGISENYNLLSLLNGKADKSYVDTNFVTLGTKQTITGEKNFTGGLKVNGSPIYYDATNKYWKLEGDLLVTGGVSMYSDDSEFTPSTIMDGVVVDGTSIRKNPTTGALEVIGGSGATVKYPLSWSGFNQGSYDGSVAQSFYIPTKLSEFVNDRSFATTSDLSGYLPTSGGTINGSLVISNANFDTLLTINRSNGSGSSVIQYTNITDGFLGSIGVAGTWSQSNDFHPIFLDKNKKEYRIYHSGNLTPTEILTQLKTVDGAGSGLDADLLDGYNSNKFIRCFQTSIDINTPINDNNAPFILRIGSINQNPNTPHAYANLLHVSNTDSDTAFELLGAYGVDKLLFRRGTWKADGSGTIFTNPWKTIAFIDSNVASATKLQTARTIWGQSFDGTGNISGKLTVSGIGGWAIEQKKGDSYVFSLGSGSSSTSAGTENGILQLYQNGSEVVRLYAASGESSWINSAKLGIGTPNPAYKLDVRGSACCKYISFYNTSGTSEAGWIGRGSEANNHIGLYASTGSNVVMYAGGVLCVTLTGQNALFSGGITMYSDQRKKTILNHVELSLKQIADAPLIEHYYNSDQDKTTHVGSIAQYWAGLNDWFCKLDNEGFYTMEIQNCALASAISIARHLEKYESKTDKTIRKMKQRIEELEDEVERLKQN